MASSSRPKRLRNFLTYGKLEPRQLLASLSDNIPVMIPEADYYLHDTDQEAIARDYLSTNLNPVSYAQGMIELELVEIKRGLASTVTRFQQTIEGIPVVDGYVTTIQGRAGEFLLVHDQSYRGEISEAVVQSQLDFSAVEKVALDFAGADSTFADSRGQIAWLPGPDKIAEQVWQITVFGVTPETHGDFLTYVEIDTGTVISQENRIAHLNGTGKIYYPNPYQTQGSGTGLADNNDADSAALTNQRISVTLEGLDSSGKLIGEFVDLATLNSTTIADVDAFESDRDFDYTRSDPRFEQVVVYHTIDQINRYFHTLGFDDDTGISNGIRDFPSLANAHWYTTDNSFYSTGDDAMHFGDGGVDDAEDGDIIAHEYGHAIHHDQNAFWGGGEMGAMGEGFGDYLAASFFQNHGDATFLTNHAAAVAEWNATSYSAADPPNLRRVDGFKTYPGSLNGRVHDDGEIWSRALWDINQAIGASAADQIILESHFMLPANSSMVTGAQMILLADKNINGGSNEAAIRTAFEDRGILQAPPEIGKVTVNASVYSVGDVILITVRDGNAPASVPVTIVSSNGDTVSRTLTGSGGVYSGSLTSVAGSPSSGDNLLQAALGDTFTVTYKDTNDGTGNTLTATDNAAFAVVTTRDATDLPKTISDNATILSTIAVTDSGSLLEVEVQLDITHTWVGDLTGLLIAPDGQQITLFDRFGRFGDDYDNTRFDDDAAVGITDGTPPYTGTFRPAESFAALSGISITGNWVLAITDNATRDVGVLNSWSLSISVESGSDIGSISDSDSAPNVVSENASVGSRTGITAMASDPGDSVTYMLTNNAGGRFSIDTNTGVISVAGQLDYESADRHVVDVRATSSDSSFSDAEFTIMITNVNDAVISSRQIFYEDSSYDNSDVFDAVAPDKQPLVAGQTATFANYSSYWLGLNGLALEVNDLNKAPTLATVGDYFDFKVGNDDTTNDWANAPTPAGLTYRSNVDADGTDQVILTWNDNAIQNQWLQVTVLSGGTTGLASPDIFYFGNVIAESGNDSNNALVNLQDIAITRANLSGFGSADIENEFDYDRNGKVDLIDIAIARENQSGFSKVNLITPGSSNLNSSFGAIQSFLADGVILPDEDQKTLNLDRDRLDWHKNGQVIPQTRSLSLSGTGEADVCAVTTAFAEFEIDELFKDQAKLESSTDEQFEQLDFLFEFPSVLPS